MGTLAETYRRKGDEAAIQGAHARDPFIHRMSLTIADHWHTLADRIERAESYDSRPRLAYEDSVDDLIKTLELAAEQSPSKP